MAWGIWLGFSTHRIEGRPSGRMVELVDLFYGEVARMVAGCGGAACEAGRVLAGLMPRLRQVLDGLMEGEGKKQVAARLGLSRATVHNYVAMLHRRFAVSRREQLLAKAFAASEKERRRLRFA